MTKKPGPLISTNAAILAVAGLACQSIVTLGARWGCIRALPLRA